MFDHAPLTVSTGSSAGCPACDFSVRYVTSQDEWEPVRQLLIEHFLANHADLLT